jgi:hypothetical protein
MGLACGGRGARLASSVSIACAGIVLIGGCGRSSHPSPATPSEARKAAMAFVAAFHDHDVHGVCDAIMPSTDLPVALARKIDVPSGSTGSPSQWDADHRECLRDFGRHGEFARAPTTFTVSQPRVTRLPAPAAEIDAVADATTVTGAGTATHRGVMHLVHYRGDWKVVFGVD